MDVNSTIHFDSFAINKLNDSVIQALISTADKLRDDIRNAQVVPFDTGNLNGEAFNLDTTDANNGHVVLVHATPYSRRLYYHPEYNFNTELHENAKGRWFEDWLPGGDREQDVEKTFFNMLRREMKN